MRSTSIFPCIVAAISNFTIFFIFQIPFKFSLQYNIVLHFHMIPASLLLTTSFFILKLIIFIACSLKDSQKFFFWQSLFLYTPSLFFMLQNEDILDIEKSDEICSPDVNVFSGLFLLPSIFSIKN